MEEETLIIAGKTVLNYEGVSNTSEDTRSSISIRDDSLTVISLITPHCATAICSLSLFSYRVGDHSLAFESRTKRKKRRQNPGSSFVLICYLVDLQARLYSVDADNVSQIRTTTSFLLIEESERRDRLQ